MYRHGLELRSKSTTDGFLELFLQETPVPEPAADEIVIRIEAAPLNPSDIILLLGPADPSVVRPGRWDSRKTQAVALLAKEHITGLQARVDVESAMRALAS
jgi:NADPH2:quinone reductase